MFDPNQEAAQEPRAANGAPRPASRRRVLMRSRWERWVNEPRNAVLVLLGVVILVGGGRRLRQLSRAKKALARLEGIDVSPEALAEAALHGRACVYDLFRLLAEARSQTSRHAAGRALARLWKADELIPEEEKALVQRGFDVDWQARRRYPRALRSALPFRVEFGLPFLEDEDAGLRASNLEWSYRILGARRASLEKPSVWTVGPAAAAFEVIPDDFESNGPHRLLLDARVRTRDLDTPWEIALAQVPFTFEFDPRLAVDSILASPDAAQSARIAQRLRLVAAETDAPGSTLCAIEGGLALRSTLALDVETPLPCDLAGSLSLEIEGQDERVPVAPFVIAGQGDRLANGEAVVERIPLRRRHPLPSRLAEKPGRVRLRAWLEPDPELGWGDPAVRSVWPEPVATNWLDVEVIRS